MESLREHDSALFRANKERSGLSNRNGQSRDVASLPEPTANPEQTVAPIIATAPSLEQDRSARDYRDERVPVKVVPYAAAKRVFDLIVSALLILLFSPILILTAIAVKLTSKGPIIFRQTRVGVGGRHFICYKFRSMCVDAEARKEQLMHLNEASGPVFKIKHDPRITPIGAFIRKFSIDEMPQLFNVFKGDMSLVGPRPPIPAEVELYTERQFGRLAVQQGLTCLWQVSGRSNLSFERWVELDLLYIDTMSFAGDMVIMVRTIPAVLKGSGAH